MLANFFRKSEKQKMKMKKHFDGFFLEFCKMKFRPWRLITATIPGDTAAIPGDIAAIPSDSGRSPVPPMTHDPQLVRFLAHAATVFSRHFAAEFFFQRFFLSLRAHFSERIFYFGISFPKKSSTQPARPLSVTWDIPRRSRRRSCRSRASRIQSCWRWCRTWGVELNQGIESPPNFEWLVLGCIEADFCK